MARWFSGATISRIHGQPQRFGDRLVMPMFHPAAALRRGDLRAVIAADFAQIPRLLEQARAARLDGTVYPAAAPGGTGHPAAAPGGTGYPAAAPGGTGERAPEPAAPAARQASPASQRSLL
jgi:DNA polymerase